MRNEGHDENTYEEGIESSKSFLRKEHYPLYLINYTHNVEAYKKNILRFEIFLMSKISVNFDPCDFGNFITNFILTELNLFMTNKNIENFDFKDAINDHKNKMCGKKAIEDALNAIDSFLQEGRDKEEEKQKCSTEIMDKGEEAEKIIEENENMFKCANLNCRIDNTKKDLNEIFLGAGISTNLEDIRLVI